MQNSSGVTLKRRTETIVAWLICVRNNIDPNLFISLLTTAYASIHVIVHDGTGLQSGTILIYAAIERVFVYFFAALTNPYSNAIMYRLNCYS